MAAALAACQTGPDTLGPAGPTTPTTAASVTARAPLSVFDHDPSADLDVVRDGILDSAAVLAVGGHGDVPVHDVSFASPHGGRVPAYLAEPIEDPAPVGIIMVPGIPESRGGYLQPITEWACAGASAIVVDPPWAREQRPIDQAITFTDVDRDEQIQLVVDLRRTIDLLEQELEVERIGFDAISYGAAIGAQLAGVDDRVDGFVLMSLDGGLIDHFTTDGEPTGPLAALPADEQQAWIEAMSPIEPVLYVGDATAPILFMHGRDDSDTPPDKAERVHAAAGDGAEVRWYDAGHLLEPAAFVEHFEWLSEKLGLDADRVSTCIEDRY